MLDTKKVEAIFSREILPQVEAYAQVCLSKSHEVFHNKKGFAYKPDVIKNLDELFSLKIEKEGLTSFNNHIAKQKNDTLDMLLDFGMDNAIGVKELKSREEKIIAQLKKSGLDSDEIDFEMAKRKMARRFSADKADEFCPKEAKFIEDNQISEYTDDDLILKNSILIDSAFQKISETSDMLQNKFNELLKHFGLV